MGDAPSVATVEVVPDQANASGPAPDEVRLDPARQRAVRQEPTTLKDVLGNRTVPVVDVDGHTHELPALRIGDIEDLEEAVGGLDRFWDEAHRVDHAITVVWCSVRREGLTAEQRMKREWRYTRDQVRDMFVMSIPDLLGLAASVMQLSGFSTKSSSPLAGAPATTGETSSPAA